MNGHIRKRGRNTWSVVIDQPRGPDGRRRQKWHSVKGTRKDAERERNRLCHELNTGQFVEPTNMTVAAYLTEWLEHVKTRIDHKTFERYEQIVRLHLAPCLGSHRLIKLEPMQIQACYSELLRNGRKDRREGGLSAQTVVHIHRALRQALRQALQQAVKWRRLVNNPANAVEPPRARPREPTVLDEQQTAKLIEGAKGTRLYIPILLAVTTGMRRGEVLGLRWQDVDLANSSLTIAHALGVTEQGVRLKPPKTAKSRRRIDLPPMTVDALSKHRVQQAKERLQLGPEYKDHGYVCGRIGGTAQDPAESTAGFRKLLKELGLPRIRFHDLRHSHATHLLRLGIHPKVVSERLGHSGVGITLNTYSHLLPGMQEYAAQLVDQVLSGAGGPCSSGGSP